jgi:hypothetical protein
MSENQSWPLCQRGLSPKDNTIDKSLSLESPKSRFYENLKSSQTDPFSLNSSYCYDHYVSRLSVAKEKLNNDEVVRSKTPAF